MSPRTEIPQFLWAPVQCLTTLMVKIFSIELMRISCFPACARCLSSCPSLALSSLLPPTRYVSTKVRFPPLPPLPQADQTQLPSFKSALLTSSLLTIPLRQPSDGLYWGQGVMRAAQHIRAVNLHHFSTLIEPGSIHKGESGLQHPKPASVLAVRPMPVCPTNKIPPFLVHCDKVHLLLKTSMVLCLPSLLPCHSLRLSYRAQLKSWPVAQLQDSSAAREVFHCCHLSLCFLVYNAHKFISS